MFYAWHIIERLSILNQVIDPELHLRRRGSGNLVVLTVLTRGRVRWIARAMTYR